MKTILIKYISVDDDVKGIRENQSSEAIGRYMEKYESGTSKPILVKEIDRQHFILIDGHHRLEACKKLKYEKIDVEPIEIDDKNIYARAVEENQGHGVSLTKDEEEKIIGELIKRGRLQIDIAKILTKTNGRISQIIKSSKILTSLIAKQTNISTTI